MNKKQCGFEAIDQLRSGRRLVAPQSTAAS